MRKRVASSFRGPPRRECGFSFQATLEELDFDFDGSVELPSLSAITPRFALTDQLLAWSSCDEYAPH